LSTQLFDMKYFPGFALWLASCLQPMHLMPWTSWHSEVLAFAAVAWWFAVELLTSLRKGQRTFALPVAAAAPLALGLLALIQFGADHLPLPGELRHGHGSRVCMG
jgi:hypothetical protein